MYPQLFAPRSNVARRYSVTFSLFDQPSQPDLVANVALVPRVGGQFVVVNVAGRGWTLPAGTLEPGESWSGGLKREVMEEAGAEIISARIVGGWEIFVHGDTSLRPGVPHPRFFRLLHVGEVRLTGRLEPVEDGETILEVRAVSLKEAEELFNRSGRPELAELYRLTDSLFSD
jgi:8-oxo-dGTP pyrophosphatase MutT (NUDIX family)